ncbi:MAG: hypothetical protein ACYCZF_12895 [Anaerolineae bacterium]
MLEDPLAFTRALAPFVYSSHLKDSFIYLEGEGIHWLSGCELGQVTVNVAAIVEKLYQANQWCNLSVEDHRVRSTHPLLRLAFLDSLGPWDGEHLAKFWNICHEARCW